MGKTRPTTDEQSPKFLRRSDLMARWNISPMTLERRIAADPDFPKSVRFEEGDRAWRYWLTTDVEAYEKLLVTRGPAKKIASSSRTRALKTDAGDTVRASDIKCVIVTLHSGKRVRIANLDEVLAA